MRRPVPLCSDTIGPWLENLGLLTWLGSITTAALVFLFSGDKLEVEVGLRRINSWGFWFGIILSEQLYFSVRYFVRYGLAQMEWPGLRLERRQQFRTRKRYLDKTLGAEATEEFTGATKSATPAGVIDGIDYKGRDDKTRTAGFLDTGADDGILRRRRDRQKSVSVGVEIIRQGPQTRKIQ